MSTKMILSSVKVLVISSEFPPQPGGIGRHSHDLTKHLVNSGIGCKVLTNSRGTKHVQNELNFDNNQLFEVIRIKRARFRIVTVITRLIRAVLVVLNHKFDVLIVTGKFSIWLVIPLRFLGYSNRILAITHGSELGLRGLKKELTKRGLDKSDDIVAVSNFTKRKTELILSSDRLIHIIPNGIDLDRLNTQNLIVESANSEYPVLVTVGSLTRRKGQHNVIAALPRLLEVYPLLSYYMIGMPRDRDKLYEQACKLGVNNAINFCGSLSDLEMLKIVTRANVFIMLSENLANGDVEGFGIAILEANSQGIPAIGSKGCGIEDAIQCDGNGFLVDSKSPDEILTALKTILDNHDRFSVKSKEWANKFAWEHLIQRYMDILNL